MIRCVRLRVAREASEQSMAVITGSKIGTSYAHLATAGGETHTPGIPSFAEPEHEGLQDPEKGSGLGPLGQLLALPVQWHEAVCAVIEARDAVVDALAREVWANRNDISNAAQTGTI